jgi:RNA polymerase sigma-70 factor (ECF subfamily)
MTPGTSSEPAVDPGSERLASLLQAIGRGDDFSLAALYDATNRWVYALVSRILGDLATAEEVTLDVYLQVWRQAAAYSRTRGTPAAWLATIARSRAIDRLRSGATRRAREEPFGEGFDQAAAGQSPSDASVEAERRRLVTAAVAALPREQGRAIELAFFQGLTHAEIADRLGEPLGTVKTRVRLGMMKLRGSLKVLEMADDS